MKKHLKKAAAAATAAMIGLCCLTACGNKDGSSSGAADPAADSNDSGSSPADDNLYYNGQDIDTGWKWGNVQIVGGGYIPGIIYNRTAENVAYVRTDMGGAYRLNAETGRWDCITDCIGADDWNLNGIESIATDPVEPNRVYLACGTYSGSGNGAIFVSEDYGDNWIKVDLPFGLGGNELGRGAGERLAVDPNDNSIVYFGTRSSGLYRSTDYGKTWAPVESFPTSGTYGSEGYSLGLTFVAFDESSSSRGEKTKTIFVGAACGEEDNVFRSDDGGETWTAIPGSNPDTAHGEYPYQGKVSNGSLYVTYTNGMFPNQVSRGHVFKINIATNEVKDISPASYAFCGLDVIGDTVAVSTVCCWVPEDNIYVSYDGGESWTGFWDNSTKDKNYEMDVSEAPWLSWHGQQKLGWWISAVALNPFNTDELLYGTGATIYGTKDLSSIKDGKITISTRAMGVEECAIFDLVSPADPNGPELYSTMGDIYGFAHFDVNTPAEQHFGDFPSTDLAAADDAAQYVVRATESGTLPVTYSTDYGKTWNFINTLPEGAENAKGGTVAISCDGSSLVWQTGAAGAGAAYVTTDFGESWTECDGVPGIAKFIADGVNPNKFYAVYDGSFYVSEDGGKTFKFVVSSLLTNFDMVANSEVEGELWLAAGGGVFKVDMTAGTAPTIVGSSVTEATAIGLGKAAEGSSQMAIYILGDANGEGWGVYQSIDGGETWKKINDDTERWGNVNKKICGDPKVYGRCYISTNGRGIIMGNVNE